VTLCLSAGYTRTTAACLLFPLSLSYTSPVNAVGNSHHSLSNHQAKKTTKKTTTKKMPARAAKTDAVTSKSDKASQIIQGAKATAYHVYGQVREGEERV